MNRLHLSHAFSKRTVEELEFLRKVNGTTGFGLFWSDVVRPLLCELKGRNLLEIGAFKGDHTRLLLEYCDTFDANLIVIEPSVTPSLQEVVSSSTRVRLFAEKSHEALPRVDAPVEAVLLEGDLNYYTVRGDLVGIEELSIRQNVTFPIVFFANASWPYARRDMYYDPEGLPATGMHDCASMGMTPWSSELEEGMINYPFANARHENGPKNGVLTAVEDFINESQLPLRLFRLPINHGLGIICIKNSRAEEFISTNLLPPSAPGRFLETSELARLNDIIRRLKSRQRQKGSSHGLHKRLARVLRRLGRIIIGRIEQ